MSQTSAQSETPREGASAPPFFLSEGDTWIPQRACIGPWSPELLHAGPIAALCVSLGEELAPGENVVTSRLTLDLLRPIRALPLQVRCEWIKQGRRVSILQIHMQQDGRDTVWGSVQRTALAPVQLPDLSGSGVTLEPPPDQPEDFHAHSEAYSGRSLAPFVDEACQIHTPEPGGFLKEPATIAWLCVTAEIEPGRPLSTAAAVAAAADCGNALGAPVTLDPPPLMFMNADLTIHLVRAPHDAWVRMQPDSIWQENGLGQTRCSLSDRRGMLGTSVVTLPLAERP